MDSNEFRPSDGVVFIMARGVENIFRAARGMKNPSTQERRGGLLRAISVGEYVMVPSRLKFREGCNQ